MAKVTAADIFSVYVKPSLDGELVFRKKTTSQSSPFVEARKEALRSSTGDASPARRCHERLVSENKCPAKMVYVEGSGYQLKNVCPIKAMKGCLSQEMTELHRRSNAVSIKADVVNRGTRTQRGTPAQRGPQTGYEGYRGIRPI